MEHSYPWGQRLLFLLGNTIVFVAITVATVLFLDALTQPLVADTPLGDQRSNAWPFLLFEWSKFLVGVCSGLLVINWLSLQLPISTYGFQRKGARQAIRWGVLTALILLLIAFSILWIGGWLQISRVDWQAIPLLGWLLFFLIQPLTEEIVIRCFLQNQLHRFFGQQAGLWIPALVFGLIHLGNPHFSWIAGLEIVAGGLLMGLLYLRFGSVWAPWAMHAAWNFTQSTLLGFAVSGIDTYRILHIQVHGPAWLTGGAFGLEGSLLSLLLSLLAIIYFWPAKTSQELPFILAIRQQKQADHESDPIA